MGSDGTRKPREAYSKEIKKEGTKRAAILMRVTFSHSSNF
jgi:hypothetical protein